jgi:hypothetical protein
MLLYGILKWLFRYQFGFVASFVEDGDDFGGGEVFGFYSQNFQRVVGVDTPMVDAFDGVEMWGNCRYTSSTIDICLKL